MSASPIQHAMLPTCTAGCANTTEHGMQGKDSRFSHLAQFRVTCLSHPRDHLAEGDLSIEHDRKFLFKNLDWWLIEAVCVGDEPVDEVGGWLGQLGG